jgi:hypothetical protein
MSTNHGTFSGEPLLRWLTESDADRKMKLEEDFSFTDPEEVARVRNSFLKKKLELTQPDAELDAAIGKIADFTKCDIREELSEARGVIRAIRVGATSDA